MRFVTYYRSCAALVAGAFLFTGIAARAGQPVTPSDGKASKAETPEENWQALTITPVTSPIFFEDPVIHSEVRPIFAYHRIDPKFVTGGGNTQVYALQARWAVTDRLAIIATKDGYINMNPRTGLTHQQGWADVALGAKYALIDDRRDQFILTPGFTAEIPLGNENVFQGTGKGSWNLFVSAEKGFDKLHITGNVGVSIPNDQTKNNTILHYSAQVDYYCCRWFIPFAAFNGYTVLTASNAIGLDTEGYDLINFGSSAALHRTQGTMGFGFRSRLLDRLDFGAAYDFACISPHGLEEDRLTVDLIWHF
ncbi:MAG: transporter [Chthoniobacter sp.]|nr:transporter [Chthoniobacter sp.]